jgi:hypothetical protein
MREREAVACFSRQCCSTLHTAAKCSPMLVLRSCGPRDSVVQAQWQIDRAFRAVLTIA